MASIKKDRSKKHMIPVVAAGVGTASYFGSRSIDISDKADITQQRLIAAHNARGTGVGFKNKPRAILAKIIYEPRFKYFTYKSEIRDKPPGVLFSKLLANTEGGITINGPQLFKAYRSSLRNKAKYPKLKHIGKYFPETTTLPKAFAEVGIKNISKTTDKELLHGITKIEKKRGAFFYKQKPDFDRGLGHSMLGLYGHSKDVPLKQHRVDINFWDRLQNIDIKYKTDPELLTKLRKEAPNLLISKDWGTGHKEYRMEILGDRATLLNRFGRKKGMKVILNKDLTSEGRAGYEAFVRDYKKYLSSKGAYKHIHEVPFVGADIIIPRDGKIKAVELQWNSGFPFHAKEMKHMISKPYGSTGRMVEYITGKISHPKGLAVAGATSLATYGGIKLLQKSKGHKK